MKTPKHNPLAKEMATNAPVYRVRITPVKKGKGSYRRERRVHSGV